MRCKNGCRIRTWDQQRSRWDEQIAMNQSRGRMSRTMNAHNAAWAALTSRWKASGGGGSGMYTDESRREAQESHRRFGEKLTADAAARRETLSHD